MSRFALAMTRNRIAEGTVNREQERIRVTAEFKAAKKDYIDTCKHLVSLFDRRAQLVADIQQFKDNMEGIIAGWRTSGEIVGTNETQRKASLDALKASDQTYMNLLNQGAACERALKIEVEPEIVREEQRIRLARYTMEFAITEGRMIAGEDDERHQR